MWSVLSREISAPSFSPSSSHSSLSTSSPSLGLSSSRVSCPSHLVNLLLPQMISSSRRTLLLPLGSPLPPSPAPPLLSLRISKQKRSEAVILSSCVLSPQWTRFTEKNLGCVQTTFAQLQLFVWWWLLQGLRNGGGIGDVLRQPSSKDPLFMVRVLYDILFFFIVIIIVLNLIFGVIIDTFADLR